MCAVTFLENVCCDIFRKCVLLHFNMEYFQRRIVIGSSIERVMILSNQKLCKNRLSVLRGFTQICTWWDCTLHLTSWALAFLHNIWLVETKQCSLIKPIMIRLWKWHTKFAYKIFPYTPCDWFNKRYNIIYDHWTCNSQKDKKQRLKVYSLVLASSFYVIKK